LTRYKNGGNLALIPVNVDGISSTLDKGHTAYVHEKMEPALILRRSTQTTLPFRMDNVAYPLNSNSVGATVTALSPVIDNGVETSGIRVWTQKGTDYVVFTSGPKAKVAFKDADIRLKGQFGCVRTDEAGAITGFALVHGTKLQFGSVLVSAYHPVSGVDVIYDRDTVRITASEENPSLRVAALGRVKFSVNGGPPRRIITQGGMFQPFEERSEF
jgi:hypothetical protein